MAAYYNEFDPYAAEWLRNLIAFEHIAPGDVDERDIKEVSPDDLRGYDQCHFFAGIGGWSKALRLTGWPDDRPVWTGSCPCQPFSVAGKQKAEADERHLWPEFRRLVQERAPATVFGEQVASRLGREWLSGVRADLEDLGYAVGAADLCAASVGASHIRQRLWWVADARSIGRQGGRAWRDDGAPPSNGARCSTGRALVSASAYPKRREWSLSGPTGRVGRENGIAWNGHWEVAPEPFICSGVNGFPSRMGRLRAYGNAIVPQVAAQFIAACA